ncbi:MAG: HypC/HybG/HupF family hydrogenase formation chaperone [Alsobacter sp.]
MCLAIPVKVIDLLPDDMAKVSLDGVTKVVSVALVPEVAVGDYVVLHVGYALARIDEEEATRTLALLGEAARIAEGEVAS